MVRSVKRFALILVVFMVSLGVCGCTAGDSLRAESFLDTICYNLGIKDRPTGEAEKEYTGVEDVIASVKNGSFSEDTLYVPINGNSPDFSDIQVLLKPGIEHYAELDEKGRCGVTYALVGPETIPTEERGSIGQVKPTGWKTVKYDCVDGKYLYNRCHLIGFQLAGENANKKNLITGTRSMNVDGMLPFENMVADYVKETGNHVVYRVTPKFDGEDLVATGVLVEAMSYEDSGESILFNVFVLNTQPGVNIDYSTGSSSLK